MAVIGISSSHPNVERGAVHADVLPYVRAVECAGGEAMLLANDPRGLDEMLAPLDGIILTGGVDVDPAHYGGNPVHANSEAGSYQPERDAFEMALARAAREGAIPTLCICRGLQIANVAFGGTLIEDVGEELGKRYTIDHRQTDDAGRQNFDYVAGHEVTLARSSSLARLLGQERFTSNSAHHQAVRTLGDGFVAAGYTTDGVIEALDATFVHPFFHAVQWHPEVLEDETSTRLFRGLIAASAAGSRTGSRTG